jgi:hypothetical protein
VRAARVADIFFSYTVSDREWAFWVGQELHQLGHTVHLHDWEIRGGDDIMAWMEARHHGADHILCIVSRSYLGKPFSSLERRAAQWAAAKDRKNFLLPVFVEVCEAPTLLAPLKRCDLYGVTEYEARERLKSFIEPAGRPLHRVPFPGEAKVSSAVALASPSPPFPGRAAGLSTVAVDVVPGQDTDYLIRSEFNNSDALFTISSEKTLLVATQERSYFGFMKIINELWDIDRNDSKSRKRILVWVLERDRSESSGPSSELKIKNIEELRARFRFIKARSDGVDGEARWNWLRSSCVFMIHEMDHTRLDYFNIIFSDIPGMWIDDLKFRDLYFGDEFSRVRKVSYTIFFDRSRMNLSNRRLSNQLDQCSLSYFGHAVFQSDNQEALIQGIKLPSLDRNYALAFLTAYVAAIQFLGLSGAAARKSINRMEALKKLKLRGFSLLNLDKFTLRADEKLVHSRSSRRRRLRSTPTPASP